MAPSNTLPMHGNEKTMNLNSLVLANIQASPYFKVHLYELKTYHQVIDEIYYKVNHLEPWEKGSRKTAGQTGMCGGVRGVGTGGIVSSAFCLLYKLHTLKLTRKQLIGLCNHADSPYIRALGFMYIRFTQPSGDLWEWFEPYLEDEEELDVKAGGGHVMTIGDLVEHFLTKLDWYSTLFPRIAVPVQKQIEQGMRQHKANKWRNGAAAATAAVDTNVDNSGKHSDSHSRANDDRNYLGTERIDDREARRRPDLELESRASERHSGQCGSRHRSRSRSPRRSRSRGRSSKERRHHSQSHRSQERRRSHSHSRHRRSPPSDRRRSASRDRGHSRRDKQEGSKHHRDRRRTPSVERKGTSRKMEGGHHSRNRHNESEDDFKRDLKKEMERIKREKDSKTKDGQQ